MTAENLVGLVVTIVVVAYLFLLLIRSDAVR